MIETQSTNPIKTTKPRRWFRFRLRTLLIMVTLLSVPLGWVGWELDQRRREKAVVKWVEEMGGEVHFNSYYGNVERSWWEKTKDRWLGERVRAVRFHKIDIFQFAAIHPEINMRNLSPLVALKHLESLDLRQPQASEEQLQKLRLALPNCEIRIFIH